MPVRPSLMAGPDTVQECGGARFAQLDAGGAGGLGEAVRAALAPHCPADASNLTASGAPIEAGFVWPRAAMRLTVDPDPRAPAVLRSALCRVATENGLTHMQRAVVARLGERHRREGARWGAWLGLRGRGDALRRKLYLEIPIGSAADDPETAPPAPRGLAEARRIQPTMMGLDGDRGGTELYCRAHGLHPAELDTLLDHAGMARRGGEIVRVIETLTQRTIRWPLPSGDMGFSIARDEHGKPLAFTWYSTSRALLGPPGRARAAVLRAGLAAGWDLSGYAALTAGDATPHHGVIGVTIPVHGPLEFNASVAILPPDGPHG